MMMYLDRRWRKKQQSGISNYQENVLWSVPLFHEWRNLESLAGWIPSHLSGYCEHYVYIY
jgi:hypothetical protein